MWPMAIVDMWMLFRGRFNVKIAIQRGLIVVAVRKDKNVRIFAKIHKIVFNRMKNLTYD
jgi:hypothetical protein